MNLEPRMARPRQRVCLQDGLKLISHSPPQGASIAGCAERWAREAIKPSAWPSLGSGRRIRLIKLVIARYRLKFERWRLTRHRFVIWNQSGPPVHRPAGFAIAPA